MSPFLDEYFLTILDEKEMLVNTMQLLQIFCDGFGSKINMAKT